MDALLADELREATDELLDITPARPLTFPPSPHLQQLTGQSTSKVATASASRLATFSSSSKLEVLYSPTDVRPWQWPVPPTTSASGSADATAGSPVVASESSHQSIKGKLRTSVHEDADDNLPSRGLSSLVHSVKAATGQEHDKIQLSASSPFTGDVDQDRTVASSSKLRVRTPINDVFINQYGERVVRGKVVGRILGGRPRPPSRNEDSSHQSNGALSNFQSVQQAAEQPSPNKRSMQASAASSPPAFFLESFPDAFTAEPSMFTTGSPFALKMERRLSKGGPPSLIKAPRAVAGALTLDNTENFEDARLLPDGSFKNASDFGSPSSSSSKHLSFSSKPQEGRSFSASCTDSADEEISPNLQGLQLHNVEQAKSPMESTLLSPSEGVQSTDTPQPKIELPSFRRPTPTIELSQARAHPVVLHGNKRQARASGVVQPCGEASNSHGSGGNQSAVPPPAMTAALLSGQGEFSSDRADMHCRLASASEPSSPLLSSRIARFQHGDTPDVATRLGEQDEQADDGNEDDNDKASLESAPSSLISLPVSTLTSSSRSPSHHSLERRRSSTGSMLSHTRRRSSSSMHQSSSDVFAREVRIRGWSEVGSQARGWVVFELRIITKQGTPIVAHKRFSSFVKLHSSLLKECKDQAKWLPELPTRRTGLLSKYDARYLEKRRRALQRWLEVVALDKVWGASEALREWVLASD